jgi:hypothetical protein
MLTPHIFAQNDFRIHLPKLRYKVIGHSAWNTVAGNTHMKRKVKFEQKLKR